MTRFYPRFAFKIDGGHLYLYILSRKSKNYTIFGVGTNPVDTRDHFKNIQSITKS